MLRCGGLGCRIGMFFGDNGVEMGNGRPQFLIRRVQRRNPQPNIIRAAKIGQNPSIN